jgi:hypothetical protein
LAWGKKKLDMEFVAGPAAAALQKLIATIVKAAGAVKMYPHQSKGLAGRVAVLKSCLLSITQDQQAYEAVRDLLQGIAAFLEKLQSQSRISSFRVRVSIWDSRN